MMARAAGARCCSSTSPCRATSTPRARDLPGVTLFDMDDLQAQVARNLLVREAEARRAEGIVEEEIQRFAGWLGSLEVLPTIAALREHGDAIVEQVLAENAGALGGGSPSATARGSRRSRARS